MWSALVAVLQALFGAAGKTYVDVKKTEAERQRSENESGERAVGTFVGAQTAAGEIRASVQKSQGSWGPFGLAGFVIAMTLAFHVVMIVLDSTSWHLALTTKWYVLPWLEWQHHTVGSWGVAALPGKFEDTEHEILKALFYVGPPSAALAVVAKAFRR
jgi:hypothetical protein